MEVGAIRLSRVAIRYFDGCPNWRETYQRLNEVLADTGHDDMTVALERIDTPEDAVRLSFVGSPTILLDGEDPFEPDVAGGYGLSCRIYRTPEGVAGSPSREQLRHVLSAHLNGQETS
jgi:hypothetical protein